LGLTTGLDTVVTSLLDRRLVGPHNRLGHCGDKSVRQEAGWASQQAWPVLTSPLGCRVSKPDYSIVKPLIKSLHLLSFSGFHCGKELFEFQKEIFRIHTVYIPMHSL